MFWSGTSVTFSQQQEKGDDDEEMEGQEEAVPTPTPPRYSTSGDFTVESLYNTAARTIKMM